MRRSISVNQGYTVTEAINRQLGHYAYHVGQIVFIGKMIRASQWKSLSIPKGGSVAYNKEKILENKTQKPILPMSFLNENNEVV